jgi:MFS family permease
VNLLAARVVLRQRSLADTLDLALPFCLTNKRPLGLLSLVMLGPVAATLGFLRIAGHWSWVWVWLLCLAAALLVQGVFTVALGELLFKPAAEARTRTFVARFVRRLPALAFAVVVRQLMSIFTLLTLAPGSIFVPEAMLLEGATFRKALARSRALARNRLGSCVGIWLATALLPVFGAVAMDVVCNAVVSFVLQLGHPAGQLFENGGSAFAVLGALLAVPLAAGVRFLGYVDLRTRKEGWDIQLRFVGLIEQNALGRRRAA